MIQRGLGEGQRVERVAGSVAGASNYSAINNPRVTRVIGSLSVRPPHRLSLARLPSFLATSPRRYQCRGTSTRLSLCIGGAFIAWRNAYRSIARRGPLMRRIATTRVPTVSNRYSISWRSIICFTTIYINFNGFLIFTSLLNL